jgi:threonyl-tRNA synthetase
MEHLNNLRHSCAHLLAAAVMELWPDTKRTIGPSIENGFYYDFEFVNPISEKDFATIENKMHQLAKQWTHFERKEVPKDEALKEFHSNPYKTELIEEFAKEGQTLTFYTSGSFTDLCRGGHIENPKESLKHFKLLSIAGAYWRGNEKNAMLTRIYGTCFDTKGELDKYLWQLEEGKKRDHKKLGKELDLFLFSELVGPGLPLWTPKGTILRNLLDDYVWELRKKRGYMKVTIPHITKKELYETSGHWDKFKNELFKIESREAHEFAMKPMNCPHHTQIFGHIPRSYKDMPQRYTETTMCYRDEQTGELSGLSRVRSFTQDDAHVFCRHNQIKDEFSKVWDIVDAFYSTFGFKLRTRLSLHDPKNMNAYLGTEEVWQKAEKQITEMADERKAEYFLGVGEAAFYGPKVDFMATDSIGREWQVATIQLDINMPERFNLFCTNEEGQEERIAMVHAAIMGSIERFMSILIEHFAGAFPTWLAPIQVAVLPVSEKHNETASKLQELLRNSDIRTIVNTDNKTLGAKIRESTLQKIPFMVIMGDKEIESMKDDSLSDMIISVRARDNQSIENIPVSEFIKILEDKIKLKSLH